MKGFESGILPERILRLVAPRDRAKLGKAGMTASEALRNAEIKSERDLHKATEGLLLVHEIEPIRARMDKRSTINVGAPDFMFAYHGRPIAFEVKLPGEKLTKEQENMKAVMTNPTNGWRWFTVHSIDDACDALAHNDPLDALNA